MNSLKMLALVLISMLTLGITSCSKDDGTSDDMDNNNPTVNLDKAFTIDTDFYDINTFETPNAYLIFHSFISYDLETMTDVTKIKNQFSFLFLDGEAISEDSDIYYSLDTKQTSKHHFRDFNDNEPSDNIESVLIESGVYQQLPTISSVTTGIADIPEEIVENGIAYGDLDLSGSGMNSLVTNEDVVEFKINSIDINYESMTGTIDCEYSISPSWLGAISGKYIGDFKILID